MVISRHLGAWRAALLALGLLAGGLAQAANSYFLKIEGVTGESVDKDHKDWIDIHSFSWGLTLATGAGGGSGGGSGRAVFSDFSWTQLADRSTPAWFLIVATGRHIPSVTLDVTRSVGDRELSFFQMIFSDTVGTGLTLDGATDIGVTASMSSGSSVTLRYRAMDDRGTLGPWVEGSFSLGPNATTAQFSGDEAVLLGLFTSGGQIAFDAGAVTTVPEPASAALLMAGLALLAVRRRRGR